MARTSIAEVTLSVIQSERELGRINMNGPEGPKGAVDIAAHIGERILRGDWISGDKLPTSKALALEFGVGERTIDAAYARLIERRLVRGVPGGGRYVV